MPRPCEICKDPQKLKIANQMVAAGETDAAIVARLGVGRMAINRHRRNHVEGPARAVAAVAAKGRSEREQREQVLARAEAGTLDPADYLSLAAIVSDLRQTGERLERVAAAAEQDGQRLAVASLAAQQHRGIELRGRLGGHAGFVPPRVQPGEAPALTVNFHFSSGRTETITMGAVAQPDAFCG